MSGRLARPVYWALVALATLALWALVLALSPSAVWAQQHSADLPSDATTVVVVAPGDSLWSIAQEQLGPQASPVHVAREVKRIHELNEALIGPDPNTIMVGQELVLARADGPSPAERVRERGVASDTVAPESESGRRAPEADATQPQAPSKPAAAKQLAAAQPAPSLPAAAKVAPVPPAASPKPAPTSPLAASARSAVAAVVAAPGMVVESGDRADERQRLGLSIIALTLLVGALMARTLPMRRRQPWWGPGLANAGTYNAAYAGLYGYPMAYGEVSDLDARGNLQTTTSGAETRPAARTSETPALPKAKHSRGNRVEDVAASRRRRLRRASRARPTGTKRRVPRRVAAGRAAEYGRRLRRRDWLTSAKRLTRLSRASGAFQSQACGRREE